jgi:hypothetical protein
MELIVLLALGVIVGIAIWLYNYRLMGRLQEQLPVEGHPILSAFSLWSTKFIRFESIASSVGLVLLLIIFIVMVVLVKLGLWNGLIDYLLRAGFFDSLQKIFPPKA